MSIVGMLNYNKDLKKLVTDALPSKRYYMSNINDTAFDRSSDLLVPCKYDASWEYAQIGRAVDYLFRFIVARSINGNKESSYSGLAAEAGLEMLKRNKDYKIYNKKYDNYINLIKKYVACNRVNQEDIIEAVYYFSNLELIYRNGVDEKKIELLNNRPTGKILFDIRSLGEVFEETFIGKIVTPCSDVVFNPHFGIWGTKCCGADADIYIDGVLYDFKCTVECGYRSREAAQVYAYYLLNLLCKTENNKDGSDLADRDITAIAIYHARHGSVEKCILADSDADYKEVLDGFKNMINSCINDNTIMQKNAVESRRVKQKEPVAKKANKPLFGGVTDIPTVFDINYSVGD